jgi:hypothetical protein
VLEHHLVQVPRTPNIFITKDDGIPDIKDDKQRAHDHEPLREERERPLEGDAVEKAQKQRRIAQRVSSPPTLLTRKIKNMTI